MAEICIFGIQPLLETFSSIQYFHCREAVKFTKEMIIIIIKYAIFFIILLEIISLF